ncbi:class I SAM-dependent methyltransferase [Patescibacteria group bacterium]|nr:class I SAM-dependent methyltransferase [Patescibacteria group bacterium]MCG2702245.1 class I SAM-dependent methyltransferase [Candidatus Parcubacteria bacterium]
MTKKSDEFLNFADILNNKETDELLRKIKLGRKDDSASKKKIKIKDLCRMRDYRLQALVNWVKLFGKKGYWDYKWLLRYGWEWIRPKWINKNGREISWRLILFPNSEVRRFLHFGRNDKINKFSRIFDLRDIGRVRKEVLKLGKFDPLWFARIFEPETKGIRAWEYGMLLNYFKKKNKKILDIGSGGSLLPDFLASSGAKVTSIDIEKPMEKRPVFAKGYDEAKEKKLAKVEFVVGDMTKLPFKKNSFDAVICISAIEHLDTKMEGGFYSKKEYWNRTIRALREMARVTKKNGLFYLTTDFYLKRQKTDNWSDLNKLMNKDDFDYDGILLRQLADQDDGVKRQGDGVKRQGDGVKIRGAYEWKRLKMFLSELNKAELKIKTDVDKYKKLLMKDKNRSNYRGRYFTTVAFVGLG